MSGPDQLVAALLSFADKRGHWPRCRQSREIGVYTVLDKHQDEIIAPCSPRCTKARKAVEAAGSIVVQQIGGPALPASTPTVRHER